jgi:hypothetical protein
VFGKHLVEDRGDVHGVVLRLRLRWPDDDAPAFLAYALSIWPPSLLECFTNSPAIFPVMVKIHLVFFL